MVIRPISGAVSGNNPGYPIDSQQTQQATSTEAAKIANDDAATVQVASGNAGQSSDRAAYVASIKEQVQNGSYQSDSRDVATALVRDLF